MAQLNYKIKTMIGNKDWGITRELEFFVVPKVTEKLNLLPYMINIAEIQTNISFSRVNLMYKN